MHRSCLVSKKTRDSISPMAHFFLSDLEVDNKGGCSGVFLIFASEFQLFVYADLSETCFICNFVLQYSLSVCHGFPASNVIIMKSQSKSSGNKMYEC